MRRTKRKGDDANKITILFLPKFILKVKLNHESDMFRLILKACKDYFPGFLKNVFAPSIYA